MAAATKDDNLSFVLNAIQDVSFQQRPIPKSRQLIYIHILRLIYCSPVGEHEILVEVKKTGPSYLRWRLGDLKIHPI